MFRCQTVHVTGTYITQHVCEKIEVGSLTLLCFVCLFLSVTGWFNSSTVILLHNTILLSRCIRDVHGITIRDSTQQTGTHSKHSGKNDIFTTDGNIDIVNDLFNMFIWDISFSITVYAGCPNNTKMWCF